MSTPIRNPKAYDQVIEVIKDKIKKGKIKTDFATKVYKK